MNPNDDHNAVQAVFLFVWFFVLYGLEFFFPLVQRYSRHFWSNVAFALLLGVVNLIFTSVTFWFGNWVDTAQIGIFNSYGLPMFWMIVVSVIFLDLWAGYVVHCLFHKYKVLWNFHAVHHSDDLVDVTTTFRQHPVESIVRIVFHLGGMAILGIPVWILMIYLTLSTINAQIEHANIKIPLSVDRILQYVFVTPNMHKVHHSMHRHETDSNFSNIFSVWDRIFGTYRRLADYAGIVYGLDHDGRRLTFWQLLKLPFQRGG